MKMRLCSLALCLSLGSCSWFQDPPKKGDAQTREIPTTLVPATAEPTLNSPTTKTDEAEPAEPRSLQAR